MSALKLVIFDVDGTLVDSQNSIVGSMHAAFAALGRTAPERAELLSIVGLSLPKAFGILAPWANEGQRAALVEAYKDDYTRSRAGGQDGSHLYPGAADALQKLAARNEVLLGIATGKSRRGLDILLKNHDLGGFFQTTQVADDHPSKPHPSMVLSALAQTGVEARDAVMVGDTTYDLDMARAAGVAAIGVGWGYHNAADLRGAGAVDVLAGFGSLLPTLDQMWATK